MSLKEEQFSAIKAVYVGRNVFVCLPTGYGKSKLYHLLWNTNLVEMELSSLCLPSRYIEFLFFSVKRQHWYRGVPLQRQLYFCAPEAVTTAKWRDVQQFSSDISG